MILKYSLILFILTSVAIISVKTAKLTTFAAITGWVIGLLIFSGTGYPGVAMIAVFFISGTAATSRGMVAKHKMGLEEKNKGKRSAGQVIANAGVAAILAVISMFYEAKTDLFILMTAAAFASATADTLSSELGNVYGKKFFNIVTLQKDTRGLNGVISFEGTIIGVAGSAAIAIVYSLFLGFDRQFLLIFISGAIGNFSDSLLGATAERKGYLNNNQVNFLNTAIASLFALLLFLHLNKIENIHKKSLRSGGLKLILCVKYF